MARDDARRRPRKALGVAGYLIVLAVLLLIPSPGTVVTLAAAVWIGIGLVLYLRIAPSPRARNYRENRQSGAERKARNLIPQQKPTRGRRGDNPHR